MMRRIFFAGCSILLLGAGFVRTKTDGTGDDDALFSIAAYLPEYRSYINLNKTTPFLTDLILFSVSPPPFFSSSTRLVDSCCLGSDHYETARRARSYKRQQDQQSNQRQQQGLRLWVTIGGAGRSNGFTSLWKKKEEQRSNFIQAIERLVVEQEIDGIDFDYENIASKDDWTQYLRFVYSAAPVFKKSGRLTSIALHAGQFLPKDLYPMLDRVHLMTYDMAGKYHADLDNVRQVTEKLIESGCPPRKIILGIPAYGRHGQNPGDVKTYSEVIDALETSEKGKQLVRRQLNTLFQWKGYQFECPQSIRQKVELAQKLKLGGVFFWELGQDKQHGKVGPGGILLEAAYRSVYEKNNYKDEL